MAVGVRDCVCRSVAGSGSRGIIAAMREHRGRARLAVLSSGWRWRVGLLSDEMTTISLRDSDELLWASASAAAIEEVKDRTNGGHPR